MSIASLRPEIRKGGPVRSRGYALSLREGDRALFVVALAVCPSVRGNRKNKKGGKEKKTRKKTEDKEILISQRVKKG